MSVRGAVLGLMLGLGLESLASADARIVVEYIAQGERIEPSVGTVFESKTFTFVVTKDHKVSLSYSSGKIVTNGAFRGIGSINGGHSVTGLPIVNRIRIDKNSLIFAEFHQTYKTVIIVNIRSDGTCDASVDYGLLPNHQYFEARSESTGAPIKTKSFRVDKVACRISETAG